MEFEVVPADRSKKPKLYDQTESKKAVEKILPKDPPQPGILPNHAYIELPILKRPAPAQPIHPMEEDDTMGEIDVERVPSSSKGKQRETVMVPTLSRVPERVSAVPRFEVADPEPSSEKPRPPYKYASELMNKVDPESVFQKLLSQPITLKLGEILGSSFELSRRFQTATKSQCFPIQQMTTSNAKVLRESILSDCDSQSAAEGGIDSDDEDPVESDLTTQEDSVNLLEASPYEWQFTNLIREVNIAQPHEYRTMVTVRLNGKIGDIEYLMLVDSGSELNIMTLQQAQDLALPINDSGNSSTLKGISGHTMSLEGICWSVPVKIGGIEFPHNFFITRSDLGNKDMILGQPWLFSHLTRIDYIHDMGVTLQLWENGDRKGRSVLINLPLIKAPRNVMPIGLRRHYPSYSIERCSALIYPPHNY